MRQLIFGGARSGKSRLAESLLRTSSGRVGYIATTDRRQNDAEMAARIARHRQQRPAHWHTIEAPQQLAEALAAAAESCDAVMVDCLTLWLSNCLLTPQAGVWEAEKSRFLQELERMPIPTLLVSNEVGMGIVPLGEISRRFVDEAGFLNQAVAARCERVVFTAAGLPLVMKGPPLPVIDSPPATDDRGRHL